EVATDLEVGEALLVRHAELLARGDRSLPLAEGSPGTPLEPCQKPSPEVRVRPPQQEAPREPAKATAGPRGAVRGRQGGELAGARLEEAQEHLGGGGDPLLRPVCDRRGADDVREGAIRRVERG